MTILENIVRKSREDPVSATTEDIRKDFPKLKRGRPCLLSPLMEDFLRKEMLHGEPSSLRTLQNMNYYTDGMARLLDADSNAHERWRWLLRPADGDVYPRKAIFYQLGRTRDDTALLVFADKLCAIKPKAAHAIRLLQNWQSAYSRLLQAERKAAQ